MVCRLDFSPCDIVGSELDIKKKHWTVSTGMILIRGLLWCSRYFRVLLLLVILIVVVWSQHKCNQGMRRAILSYAKPKRRHCVFVWRWRYPIPMHVCMKKIEEKKIKTHQTITRKGKSSSQLFITVVNFCYHNKFI